MFVTMLRYNIHMLNTMEGVPAEVMDKIGNEREKEYEVLSAHDVELLIETSEKVAKQLLEDFPAELPNIVIYPDTAARPLVYLFDEVFSAVASDRGIQKPEVHFFQPEMKSSRDIYAVRQELYSRDWDTESRTFSNTNELRAALGRVETVRSDSIFNPGHEKEAVEAIARYDVLFNRFQSRMKEILGNKENNVSVVVIDEYAMHFATTLSEIKAVFESVNSGLIRSYTLASVDMENPEVFSGKSLSYGYEDDGGNFDPFFKYRLHAPEDGGHRERFGVKKTLIEDSLYVERDISADAADMGALRVDMRHIGEKVVQKLVT